MIDFNVPPSVDTEIKYVEQAIKNKKICGDGEFTKKCSAWISNKLHVPYTYLTTSCTHALEMAAILSGIGPGDEVILPSYTFCSTADAFVQRGARLAFVDIRPDTMNIDENLIEDAINEHTKVIAVVHYAGVSCEMDPIMDIAKRHGLCVVEDAAQAIGSTYKGKELAYLEEKGHIIRPAIPEGCSHNAHMYYIKVDSLKTRSALLKFMKEKDVLCVFHYIPLHSSPAGKKYGYFAGTDRYTTAESEKLLRLPMYYGLTHETREYIIDKLYEFFGVAR